MGSNRRYQDALQRRRANREVEQHALVPRSLSEEERGTNPRTSPPVPVRAWVTYGDQPVRVMASVVEWTDVAIRILWPGLGEEVREAWVWANAVERIEP